MKLFYIEDCDYVAANSEEEAVKFYSNLIGPNEQELEIEEIPLEKWPEMRVITDEYETTESGDDEAIVFTMDEWLIQFENMIPCVVSSTEY